MKIQRLCCWDAKMNKSVFRTINMLQLPVNSASEKNNKKHNNTLNVSQEITQALTHFLKLSREDTCATSSRVATDIYLVRW